MSFVFSRLMKWSTGRSDRSHEDAATDTPGISVSPPTSVIPWQHWGHPILPKAVGIRAALWQPNAMGIIKVPSLPQLP